MSAADKAYVTVSEMGAAWAVIMVTSRAKTCLSQWHDRSDAIAYGEETASAIEIPFKRDA